MICPYDGFRAKDCSLCAAYMELNKLDIKRGSTEKVCSLAWRGSQTPNKSLFHVPEYAPNQMQATEWR